MDDDVTVEPEPTAPDDEPEPEPEPDDGEDDSDDAEADADDGGEPEPEPEPESEPAGPSPEQMEKGFDKVAKGAKRYVSLVASVAEDLGQPLLQCPVCLPQIPGFVFDPSQVPLAQAQLDGIKDLLGESHQPVLKQSPDAEPCNRCDGWGRLLTGSNVPNQQIIQCKVCRGRGWTGPEADLHPSEVPALAAVPNVEHDLPGDMTTEDDAWGTPRDHPLWGIAPQYRPPDWRDSIERWKLGLGPEAPLPNAATPS